MLDLRFDDRFLRSLPGDPDPGNAVREVRGAAWSAVDPTPVAMPRTLAVSREMARLLGLGEAVWHGEEFAQVFAGNRRLPGMRPYAANYGGHQFGHWAGQLGDGRAITLGEAIATDGSRLELQLKGAGPTPYSRFADGRAVLRSSLREFLCSEAMHHLGVPTTRALCLVGTGEEVVRDMFYDGHPRAEPGAVVCRVAPSFLRFGSFELPASRGETGLLERLLDFTIEHWFDGLEGDARQRRAAWFAEVCDRTARLMADWMAVGFVHGVMNTDNLSILGLTLDYGPYGWIEPFDPDWTPNTTDAQGRRYRFGTQPHIAFWNLQRLAGAIASAVGDDEALHAGLARYLETFRQAQRERIAAKLGFEAAGETLEALAADLYRLMQSSRVDMTLCFRRLAWVDPALPAIDPLREAFYEPALLEANRGDWEAWLASYACLARSDGLAGESRRRRMDGANPLYVPRNWLAQEAIDAAERGDLVPLHSLMHVLERPFDEQPGRERYAARRPAWADQRAGCAMLSCSS